MRERASWRSLEKDNLSELKPWRMRNLYANLSDFWVYIGPACGFTAAFQNIIRIY